MVRHRTPHKAPEFSFEIYGFGLGGNSDLFWLPLNEFVSVEESVSEEGGTINTLKCVWFPVD